MPLLQTFFSAVIFLVGFLILLITLIDESRLSNTPFANTSIPLALGLVLGALFVAIALVGDTQDILRPIFGTILFLMGAITLIFNLLSKFNVGNTGQAWVRSIPLAISSLLSAFFMMAGAALALTNRTTIVNLIPPPLRGVQTASTPSPAQAVPQTEFSPTQQRSPIAPPQQVPTSTPQPGVASAPQQAPIAPASPALRSDPTVLPAPTDLFCVVRCQANNLLNIRSGPGLNSAVIGTIPCGANTVQILSEPVLQDGIRWVLVDYNGVRGWSARNLLARRCPDRGQLG
jgi:hypothetical protein